MHSQLPGIRQLIQLGWKRIQPRYGLLILISLVPYLFYALYLAAFFMASAIEGATQDAIVAQTVLNVIAGIFFVITLLVLAFMSLWSSVATRYAVCSQQKLKFFEVFRSSRKFIWSFFWLSILLNFILTFGFVALIIPGIILTIFVWFADWILITGEARGLEAIALSRAYVRGIFWKVFWRTLIPVGLLAVIVICAFWLAGWYRMNGDIPLLVPIVFVSVIVFLILVMPIFLAYSYELFLLLKHRAGEIKVTAKQRRGFGWLAGVGFVFFVLYIVFTIFIGIFLSSLPEWSDDDYEFQESSEIFELNT